MKEYLPTEICESCKGLCCKKMPGHYSPTDFKDLSFDGLKAEIEKGLIAIDWWVANKPEYYLRARHENEKIVHGSWGGRCVNLRSYGCNLPREERPLGCRALKPKETVTGGICLTSYTKEDSKNDWKEYSDILEKLVEVFE